MGSQPLTDLLDIRSGDRDPAAQTHISFMRYRQVVHESSFSVYPKALATFSVSICFDEVMRICCDSEQPLTSGICTGFCFRAIRIVNGFRDDSVRQRYALLSFGSRLGEATRHGGGGVTTD